jgi:hypothetical protein
VEDLVLREWAQLRYLDPEKLLVGLREISRTLPLDKLEYRVASLRTRKLRKYGEGRQAALFCYAMGKVVGSPVMFAQIEDRDHDIVARYVKENTLFYAPVQLKEFVPSPVNPSATLQQELDKLGKYADATDLVVAVHVNRNFSGLISELSLPKGKIGQLWLYGALEPTQQRWCAIGDLLSSQPVTYEFGYPEV